jgi:hypothetical protein
MILRSSARARRNCAAISSEYRDTKASISALRAITDA